VAQVGQGETAVEDVFDDEDVATGQVDVEVFQDPYDAARLRRGSIGGDGHEVELERQLNAAGEVGEEDERPFEHADQKRRATGIVCRDRFAELGDSLGNLVDREDNSAQCRVCVP